MSLHRLALRLAAVEALCPAASEEAGPYPTLAGRLVYDSRQVPIDQLVPDKPRPILLVYTEEDKGTPWGSGRHRPEETIVTLVVEALIAARGTVVIDLPDGGTDTVGVADVGPTDPEHEALLDVLEAQVRYALDRRSMAPSAELYRRIAMEVRAIESVPLRDAEKTTRLAFRTISFTVQVRATEWPAPGAEPTLPEPLRTVAEALPEGSYGRDICDRVAGLVPAPPDLVPLEAIDIFAGIGRMPTAEDYDVRAQVAGQSPGAT